MDELREMIRQLGTEGYDEKYLLRCVLDALQACKDGQTNGQMSDISCVMYCLIKNSLNVPGQI